MVPPVCTETTPYGALVDCRLRITPPLSTSRLIKLLSLASLVAIIRTGIWLFTIHTLSGITPGTIHDEFALEIVSVNGVPTSPSTLKPVEGGTGAVLPTNPPKPPRLLLQAAAATHSTAATDPSMRCASVLRTGLRIRMVVRTIFTAAAGVSRRTDPGRLHCRRGNKWSDRASWSPWESRRSVRGPASGRPAPRCPPGILARGVAGSSSGQAVRR